ncbi:unnamed protein product [Kuraishia capsulata CBS 1993]|uniref:NADH dehydrogenase [ubiquinone] 1 beta subcomplex subunit 8, mitochondrial n=1 Tax=Kuraishia capsulata CBS 1993 TaxID=1382522 RepID=W6MTA1_9ASCO|nr:uncharacterized protein KUCA_T00000947001 [Kuraishia capsulata CBS 1993]CDK24980.1 unnamed protein product [Kuraishia capsulata CBS 1993]
MLSRSILTGRFVAARQIVKPFTVAVRFNSSVSDDKYKHPLFTPKEEFEGYVKVKDYFLQKRDPYLKYDDQQNRRNLDEPMHEYHDFLDMWSPDHYDFISDKTALKWFLNYFLAIAGFAGTIYVFDLWPERPNAPRSYPEGLAKDLGALPGEEKLYTARVDRFA